MKRPVTIPIGDVELSGNLEIPEGASGIVLFAHGSGSSRHSPRNRFVAQVIREAGLGTLLFDLLTLEEEVQDAVSAAFRFDIELLASRLAGATKWLGQQEEGRGRELGFFGSSTGGAAALVAAARMGERVAGVVSRGGRPDLAGEALPKVTCPVLLIVGELDEVVMGLNEAARKRLRCPAELRTVPGASHLFAEPGRLEEVARMTAEWFRDHLGTQSVRGAG